MGDEAQSALETPSLHPEDPESGCTPRGAARRRSRTAKQVGISTSLFFAGLLTYEVAFFEWDDWKEDGSPPGAMGFTGPALLWSLCALWSLSQIFFCSLHVFSAKFRGFSHHQRIKVIKYCVQIVWGTALGLLYLLFQMYFDGWLPSECTETLSLIPHDIGGGASGVELPTPSAGTAACALQWSWPYSHVITLFGSMYIWELVHEGVMIHGSLALHHFCIVLLWQLAIGYYGSRHWITAPQFKAIGDSGFGQLLAAGLEQPTFVALLLHRFGAGIQAKARAFEFAWMSFAATKLCALTYTVVAVAINWSAAPMAWNIVMLATTCGVTVTQVYSTIVLRKVNMPAIMSVYFSTD